MKRSLAVLLGSMLSLCAPSFAAADQVGESIHATLSSGSPSQYVFRGFVLADKGWIAQASSDLKVDLLDSEQLRISTVVGFWLSLHPEDRATGSPANRGPAAWFESRMDGGLVLGVGNLDMDGRLVVYSSPNGTFEDIYELRGVLAYRDEELFTKGSSKALFRGVAPSLTLAYEAKGARDGANSGAYAELAIAPRVHVLEGVALSADFAIPLKAGFSLADYYEVPESDELDAGGNLELEDQLFGYASFGGVLDIYAGFVPERLGLWKVRGYVDAVLPVAQNAAANPTTDTVELVAGAQTFLTF